MKGIRKFLILTLSLFMMFSSCLMISAEDELTLSAMQDESGDLVLSITGNDAETYISLINEGKTNISALFTIEDITKSARITNKYEKNIIANNNNLIISKETLLNKNFISGYYTFSIHSSDWSIIIRSEKVYLDLGKEFLKDKTTAIKLEGDFFEPIEGEKVSIDKSKFRLVDQDGKEIEDEYFDIYWVDLHTYIVDGEEMESYEKTNEETFYVGKAYRLMVEYGYFDDYKNNIKGYFNNEEMEIYDKYGCGEEKNACDYQYQDGTYLSTHAKTTFLSKEYIAKSSKDIEISAIQNEAGDLIVSATGSYAKKFIKALYQNSYKEDGVIIEADASTSIITDFPFGYGGWLNNGFEKIDDYTLKISKEKLIKAGYYSGEYSLNFWVFERESENEESRTFNFPTIKLYLDLGKTITPHNPSKIDIQANIDAPIEGQSTKIDLSKIVVTDDNGSKLPSVDTSIGQRTGYTAYWAEKKIEEYEDYTSVSYVPTEDETFITDKKYYLFVGCYFYCTWPIEHEKIEVTSNLNFVNTGYAYAFSVDGSPILRNVSGVGFVVPYEAQALKKEESKMDITEKSKVSTFILNDSVTDLENKILTEEDKELLKNGAEIKTYLAVSDKNISENDKKIVKKTVESKLEDSTIAQILDIKLKKEIAQSSIITTQDITNTNDKVEISFIVDDSLVNKDSSIERTYKVVRIHDSEAEILNAEFDSTTKTVKFKTDKFSTYALVYKDAKKESDSSSSKKVVTCEEAMNSKNWIWSESKKACVYKVSNTSVR